MTRHAEAGAPTLGIAGGMGPLAHIELERLLVEEALAAMTDGEPGEHRIPAWVVSSLPATPNRTAAIVGGGPCPAPMLRRSLERLRAAGADLAIIPCMTSHHFLEKLAPLPLPLLCLARLSALELAARHPGGRVAILATTGTLASGFLAGALAREGLTAVTPLDVEGGEALQEEVVMGAIGRVKLAPGTLFGPGGEAGAVAARLGEVIRAMEGACGALDAVIAGCTEIPLVLGRGDCAATGCELFDPMVAAARAGVAFANGGDGPWRGAILA